MQQLADQRRTGRRLRADRRVGVTGHRHRPGRALPGHRADRQQGAPVDRGVRGRAVAVDDVAEQRGEVGVGVEAEDSVGLGERGGQFVAVALGHAADGHHLGAGVGRGEQGVDRVLLGAGDERAGVDDHDVGRGVVGDQLVAADRRAGRRSRTSRPRCARSPGSAGTHGERQAPVQSSRPHSTLRPTPAACCPRVRRGDGPAGRHSVGSPTVRPAVAPRTDRPAGPAGRCARHQAAGRRLRRPGPAGEEPGQPVRGRHRVLGRRARRRHRRLRGAARAVGGPGRAAHGRDRPPPPQARHRARACAGGSSRRPADWGCAGCSA